MPVIAKPSQTVAQHSPPSSSACRVVFHGGQIAMTTDTLRYHAPDESGDHLQCCHVGREQPLNSGERLHRRTGPFRVVSLATIERSGQMILSAVTAPLLVARSRAIARKRGSSSSDSAASAAALNIGKPNYLSRRSGVKQSLAQLRRVGARLLAPSRPKMRSRFRRLGVCFLPSTVSAVAAISQRGTQAAG